MDAPTVTIGGQTATLVTPHPLLPLAIGDVYNAFADDEGNMPTHIRAAMGAAALRGCWPDGRVDGVPGRKWPGRRMPKPWTVTTNLLDYGAAIYADLCEAGIDWLADNKDISKASAYAASFIPGYKEDEEVEDFSEAPEGA